MGERSKQQVLDCRGEQCPAPILALSKKARELAVSGGHILVLADDEAFPLDLKSWCRSSGSALVSLSQDQSGAYQAQVQVPVKSNHNASTAAAPASTCSPGTQSPQLRVVENNKHEIPTLDCRGLQCPQPILQLSKRARTMSPGACLWVLADDEAFVLDLQSWCKSSGATLDKLETVDGVHRARLRTASKGNRPAKVPPAPHSAAPRLAGALGGNGSPMTHTRGSLALASPAPLATGAIAHHCLDLQALNPAQWEQVLDSTSLALTQGHTMEVRLPCAQDSAGVVRWCVEKGHHLKSLVDAERCTMQIEIGAVDPAALPGTQQTALELANHAADCTLLVLHNDHEALLAALLVAVGAASQGREVAVFFTFWGLNALRGKRPNTLAPKKRVGLMQKMMKKMMPKGPAEQSLGKMHFGGMGKWMLGSIMKNKGIMSLEELMGEAEAQGVRFIACTMSMDVMGITKRDLEPRSNLEFGGVAAFVEAAHGAGMTLMF